mgnify:FL=1
MMQTRQRQAMIPSWPMELVGRQVCSAWPKGGVSSERLLATVVTLRAVDYVMLQESSPSIQRGFQLAMYRVQTTQHPQVEAIEVLDS